MAGQGAREVMQGYLSALRDRGDFGGTSRGTSAGPPWRAATRWSAGVGSRTSSSPFTRSPSTRGPKFVNVVTGDDAAILEFRFVGKHIGEFAGIPATGADVDLPYCVAYDISNGQISALRAYMPSSALRAQLSEKFSADRTTAPV